MESHSRRSVICSFNASISRSPHQRTRLPMSNDDHATSLHVSFPSQAGCKKTLHNTIFHARDLKGLEPSPPEMFVLAERPCQGLRMMVSFHRQDPMKLARVSNDTIFVLTLGKSPRPAWPLFYNQDQGHCKPSLFQNTPVFDICTLLLVTSALPEPNLPRSRSVSG